MGIFRKKETYNEQMLREAGLDRVVFNTPNPPCPSRERRITPGWSPEWDAGDDRRSRPGSRPTRSTSRSSRGGDLIVESEAGDSDLAPLADAIEQHIAPPYRAAASRQEGDLWAVGAKPIEVVEFAYPDADTLELSRRDGVEELRIDGGPTDVAPPPELRQLGERAGADFCRRGTADRRRLLGGRGQPALDGYP